MGRKREWRGQVGQESGSGWGASWKRGMVVEKSERSVLGIRAQSTDVIQSERGQSASAGRKRDRLTRQAEPAPSVTAG